MGGGGGDWGLGGLLQDANLILKPQFDYSIDLPFQPTQRWLWYFFEDPEVYLCVYTQTFSLATNVREGNLPLYISKANRSSIGSTCPRTRYVDRCGCTGLQPGEKGSVGWVSG